MKLIDILQDKIQSGYPKETRVMLRTIADEARWGKGVTKANVLSLADSVIPEEIRDHRIAKRALDQIAELNLEVYGELTKDQTGTFPLIISYEESGRPAGFRIELGKDFAFWLHERSSLWWKEKEKRGELSEYEVPFYFSF